LNYETGDIEIIIRYKHGWFEIVDDLCYNLHQLYSLPLLQLRREKGVEWTLRLKDKAKKLWQKLF
jgi:hypothetical protein